MKTRSICERSPRIYAGLERDAVATLEEDGIERSRIRLAREADVRYAGQSMEVRVPAPSGAIDAKFVAGIIDAFHAAHLKAFGYNYAGQQKVEIVNFCVSGFGMIERPTIPKLAADKDAKPPHGTRRSISAARSTTRRSTIARRSPAGFRLDGPAVVEEFGSTTVVFPGQSLEVDEHGILIVRRHERRGEPDERATANLAVADRAARASRAISIRSCCRSSKARSIRSRPKSNMPSSAPRARR